MEFLYRLYSNDYFGIGLFIVITILSFSFIVVLFLGKKDEKRTKEIESNIKSEIEAQNSVINEEKEPLQAESLESVSLPSENMNEIVKEDTSSVEPLVTSNEVLNNSLVFDDIKEENTIREEQEDKSSEVEEIFNVPAFNNSSLPNLANSIDTEPEEKTEEAILDPFIPETPVIEEPVENNIFSEIEEKKPKKVAMPTQFSSVYLSKKEEKEDSEQLKEEVKEPVEEISPIPLKANFDLPKPFDLPKLNTSLEKQENTQKESLQKEEDEENIDNILENIEEDSYTIE